VVLYRRRKLLRERPAANPDLERSDGGAQAQGIERRALVPALIGALAGLSPEHRSIVLLREFHGLEYEEICPKPE
jgi:DNA-directed RNA polymerase specialized sigma24 family protein